MHIRQGLVQAAVMLAVAAVVALVAGAVWSAVQGGGLRLRTGLSCMVLAGLVGFGGGTVLSREATNDARAFLGAGPEREEPGSGRHLTGVGVFLLVSVPLFVGGGLLAAVP